MQAYHASVCFDANPFCCILPHTNQYPNTLSSCLLIPMAARPADALLAHAPTTLQTMFCFLLFAAVLLVSKPCVASNRRSTTVRSRRTIRPSVVKIPGFVTVLVRVLRYSPVSVTENLGTCKLCRSSSSNKYEALAVLSLKETGETNTDVWYGVEALRQRKNANASVSTA